VGKLPAAATDGSVAAKSVMKILEIELPDRMASAVEAMVQDGWFATRDDVLRHALIAFLRSHRLELAQQYQMEDIEWAARQRAATE
jgi:Arc/MetJ-type ribon-helix-helix transcriptional regulator